jgi:hypothetical protein
MIIRPAIDRVIEVVGARVERHLLQPIEVEPSPGEDIGIGISKNLDRTGNDLLVPPRGDARRIDVERNRPNVLVGVGLTPGAGR